MEAGSLVAIVVLQYSDNVETGWAYSISNLLPSRRAGGLGADLHESNSQLPMVGARARSPVSWEVPDVIPGSPNPDLVCDHHFVRVVEVPAFLYLLFWF